VARAGGRGAPSCLRTRADRAELSAWCHRPRYLNIQRPSYLATIRQGFAGITGRLITMRECRRGCCCARTGRSAPLPGRGCCATKSHPNGCYGHAMSSSVVTKRSPIASCAGAGQCAAGRAGSGRPAPGGRRTGWMSGIRV
jgi:hypothetical protein